MYRLLKLGYWPINNPRLLSSSFYTLEVPNGFCCQKFIHHGKFKCTKRFQSTNTNTALQNISKKKKWPRRPRKYAELLEVTQESTTESKARISNLRAQDFSLFADQPNISLAELHKLRKTSTALANKRKSKFPLTSKNITLFSNRETANSTCKMTRTLTDPDITAEILNEPLDSLHSTNLSTNALLDDAEIVKEYLEEMEHSENIDEHVEHLQVHKTLPAPPVVSKTSSKTRKKKNAEAEISAHLSMVERVAREETLSRLLLAYTGICVSQGKPNRALKSLMFYHLRSKRLPNMPRVQDIKIFNCILEGFAAKGNIGIIKEILSMMAESKVAPNINTYVSIFECLGRIHDQDVKAELAAYRTELESKGFALNDLMEKGKFINDVRDIVLSAIQVLEPNFQPQHTKPDIQYTCPLVIPLNDIEQIKFLQSPDEIINANKMETQNEIFINSDIKQVNADCMVDISHKTSDEAKYEQLNANLTDFINTNIIDLSSKNFRTISANTYHPLSSNINLFGSYESVDCTYDRSYTNNGERLDSFKSYVQSYISKYISKYNKPVVQDLFISDENVSENKLFAAKYLKTKAQQQMKMESDGYVLINSIANQGEPSLIVNHLRTKMDETKIYWKSVIKSSIRRDLATLDAQTAAHGGSTKAAQSLYACLHAIPLDELVNIVLHEVRKIAEGSETYSPAVSTLYRDVGNVVHSKYQVQLKAQTGILDKIRRTYTKYCDWYADNYNCNSDHDSFNIVPNNTVNPRQCWQALVHADNEGPSLNVPDRIWPHTLVIAVGKFLYNIIMMDLKIDVNSLNPKSKQKKLLPAFYNLFRSQGHIIKEEVKAHPVVTKLFRGAAIPQISFHASALPMYCPPRPWADVSSGGYLVLHTDMLRLPPQATQQLQRLTEVPEQSLYPSLDSLNQLAAVPWTVNQQILDLAIKVFRSGGNSRLGVAQPPSSCPNAAPAPPNATKAERFQAYRQRLTVRRKKAELYSLWCDALYKLSLANHYRNTTFWLPHNMDFRGRVYPVPPHLSHLGADLARALLVFAQERPLGPNGLRWLKLHLINLTGTKKRDSIQERLEYADANIDNILDSADNPLSGKMWWGNSEEPWQTLACCKELAQAIRSPDPEQYCTKFPVHQDGSCNGLQHYAALGRDAVGGKSVNLTPSDRPQDVYTAVATLVEAQRAKDAEAGVKIAQTLEGFVKRKVIKQTVMTTVYGVTRFGARLQIARQLKDIEEFPKESVWQASFYLTSKTFESLRSMFTSTREIQDWFTECARLISGVCGQNVEWVTPLGLPIVQPYNRYRKIEHTNGFKNRIPEHFALDTFERPNVLKQKNAFPPNFIHSLDSSHMMLTSLFCERAGITFVSVHDCYWTHPSTVSVMNKICREQFVALHSEPILESLSNFLLNKYSIEEGSIANNQSSAAMSKRKLNRVLRNLPKTGRFNLESVLQSVYFFS